MDIDRSTMERFSTSLENAQKYSDVWEIVKDVVEITLNKRRQGMMLFLDDLPIRLGAYHPLGTNNIVLNRRLVQMVEGNIESRRVVNCLIYNLLLHEYMHALGQVSELRVRKLVLEITETCFGEDHIASLIARKSPWALLRGIPPGKVDTSKHLMEIVKDFEKTDTYIV